MHAFCQRTVVNLVSGKQELLCKAASWRIILQELTSLNHLICQYLQTVSLSKDLFIWFWRLMLFQVMLWLLCTRVHWEIIEVSCAEKGSVFKLVNLLTSELNTLSLSSSLQVRELLKESGTAEEHSLNKEARKWATRVAREHKNIILTQRVRGHWNNMILICDIKNIYIIYLYLFLLHLYI